MTGPRDPRAVGLVVLVVLAGAGGWNGAGDDSLDVPARAVIVDQLAATHPNATFVAEATAALEAAGFDVDYITPDEVTVDLYRNLPSEGYGVVVLRTHATAEVGAVGQDPRPGPVTLFTNERPDGAHAGDREAGRLARVAYLGNDDPFEDNYLGIRAPFVRDAMTGRFDRSLVVAMGCQGLDRSDMAHAFLARGAGAYVAWHRLVPADRTDAAAVTLLEEIAGGSELGDAVEAASSGVGPDTRYGSTLGFVPPSASDAAVSPAGPGTAGGGP